MAKKKRYYGKNFNPGVFTFGNAGMHHTAFRKPFPLMPRAGDVMIDDSINQIDAQIKSDMKPMRRGKLSAKY